MGNILGNVTLVGVLWILRTTTGVGQSGQPDTCQIRSCTAQFLIIFERLMATVKTSYQKVNNVAGKLLFVLEHIMKYKIEFNMNNSCERQIIIISK